MNQFLKLKALCLVILMLFSCRENETLYPDIKVGKEENSLAEVTLNKETQRNIILSGGNGKYAVNIADSKVAKVEISSDTLKIKGLLEGSTFATITSHDKKIRLGINVVSPDLSISQGFVRLYPKDESKFISLSGGGDIVDVVVDDPEGIIKVKWNGNTGILELRAFYEGEATITAKSANLEDKTLKVLVKSEGETNDVGIYSTTSKNIYPILISKMVVKRKNVGVWLSSSTTPYGIAHPLFGRVSVKTAPIIAPKQGEYIDVMMNIMPTSQSVQGLKDGMNRFYIDEVRESTVVLKAKGIRVVLPYFK